MVEEKTKEKVRKLKEWAKELVEKTVHDAAIKTDWEAVKHSGFFTDEKTNRDPSDFAAMIKLDELTEIPTVDECWDEIKNTPTGDTE